MGFLFLLLLPVLFFVIYRLVGKSQYEKTEYFKQTHLSFTAVLRDKGRSGEFDTYNAVKNLGGYKRFLFNVYVPKENGETSELDVILLHESGIYVLESKNYGGWIFGSESQPYWTQTLPAGRKQSQKNRFYNPILQNKGHIKWLHAFLKDDTLHFYSYIVFSDHCVLKNITLTSGNHFVANRCALLSMLQANAAAKGAQLSPEKIDELYEKLYPLTQVGEAEKIMHILAIQERIQNETDVRQASSTRCPFCGGELVLRTASKGTRKGSKFWGCTNYPRCRYTKNISDESL